VVIDEWPIGVDFQMQNVKSPAAMPGFDFSGQYHFGEAIIPIASESGICGQSAL
jgi:hypothetical protein